MDVRSPEPGLDGSFDYAPRHQRRFLPVVLTMIGGLVAALIGAAYWTGYLPPLLTALTAGIELSSEQKQLAATDSEAPTAPANAPVPPPLLDQRTYGDWLYGCEAAADGANRNCSIAQRLVSDQSNAVVFSWTIIRNGMPNLVSLWQTPEGVRLSSGLSLSTQAGKPIKLPFEGCGGSRCWVVANLHADFVETLAKATSITAEFVLGNGQPVRVNISTTGLSDALQSLKEAVVD